MPNQFLSDEFGDIEDYFVTDYWLIDNFVGDTLWVWGTNEGFSLGINQGNVRANIQAGTSMASNFLDIKNKMLTSFINPQTTYILK